MDKRIVLSQNIKLFDENNNEFIVHIKNGSEEYGGSVLSYQINLDQTTGRLKEYYPYELSEFIERNDEGYLFINEVLSDKINEFQTRFAQTFISTLTAWAPNIASGVSHITTSVINIFMGFVMAIYMIFSKDKLIRQVKKFAHALFNDQHYQYISEVVKLTGTTFENFLAGFGTVS